MNDDDKKVNDEALKREKSRHDSMDDLFSMYRIGETEIYIITQCDRTVTTILMPKEY